MNNKHDKKTAFNSIEKTEKLTQENNGITLTMHKNNICQFCT